MLKELFTEEKFSKRLTELRLRKGVTARAMSCDIGQHPGYINNIENGKNYPSMAAFFYICQYLGITPMDFFDIESKAPSKVAELSEKLKTLKPSQLDAIQAIVDNMK